MKKQFKMFPIGWYDIFETEPSIYFGAKTITYIIYWRYFSLRVIIRIIYLKDKKATCIIILLCYSTLLGILAIRVTTDYKTGNRYKLIIEYTNRDNQSNNFFQWHWESNCRIKVNYVSLVINYTWTSRSEKQRNMEVTTLNQLKVSDWSCH